MASEVTPDQMYAMATTERVNSTISVLGIVFVIITYLAFPEFNKPINRLIFFASFGNLGSNVASWISESGPLAGQASSLCQFQAFLVQMFLGVDCLWAFCMAINVWLVFFRGFTVQRLRSLDVYYLLACYGISFIPAFVFIFIETQSRNKVYGPAIIWCWITIEWDWMRVVFLYGVVWLAILIAFIVYGMAATVIWHKRAELDGFLNPWNENPFLNVVTTEIEITHEDRPVLQPDDAPFGFSDHSGDGDNYSVNVQVHPATSGLPAALRMRSITRTAAEREKNTEAWLYARVAFLFFIALLITWVPTSANRMYAMANNGKFNFPLNYIASFLFPLQGFWNMLVYIVSSQTACRRLVERCTGRSTVRDERKPSLADSMWSDYTHHERMPYPLPVKHELRSFSSLS